MTTGRLLKITALALGTTALIAGCAKDKNAGGEVALSDHPPDLSGPWVVDNPPAALMTLEGKAPPLNDEAKKVYEAHIAARAKGDRSYDSMSRCVPPGIPRLALQPLPFSIVQGKRHVSFMHEWNHLPRIVYMTEGHFEGIGPTYLGQSVGHWDKDTLVVDTNAFNDQTLLDDSGLPHSDELTTEERYRLIDGGNRLELRVTINDPKTFTQPWDTGLKFDKRAGAVIKEDYCFRRTGVVK